MTHALDWVIAGSYTSRYAFTGPAAVSIDLTNRCDARCRYCWNYSPHVPVRDAAWQRQELTLPVLTRVLRELRDWQTQRIMFAGGGEPLLHPESGRIVLLLSELSLPFSLLTNGYYLTEQLMPVLKDAPLLRLGVSVWAATPATYARLHAGRIAADFTRVMDNIKRFRQVRPDVPVVITHVIGRENCTELEAMYAMAAAQDINALLLVPQGMTEPGLQDSSLAGLPLPAKLRVRETLLRLHADGKVPLQHFSHHFGRFCRLMRLEETQGPVAAGPAEPCYSGWQFMRILADGSVRPCYCDQLPAMGNVNRQHLREIWNGPAYYVFRRQCMQAPAAPPYFDGQICRTACDNHDDNARVRTALARANWRDRWRRLLLAGRGSGWRIGGGELPTS
ncbi:MAG TPA: radical SAM protein [bacterium]|nr:radical SAM protein [bacterium]